MRDYSTREVANLSGLTEQQVRRWSRNDLVLPTKDEHGRWRYSFQDLALLRTAAQLLGAKVSPRRVTRALHLIREQLPAGRPLSAVRIFVDGQRVVVRDRLASWEPESRQGTLDFDVKELSRPLARHARQVLQSEPELAGSAADLYQSALDLELAGRSDEAGDAYRAALELDKTLISARINLGRLLHASKRVAEAESLYRTALEQDPHNALAAFNLGVALEDQKKSEAAIEFYRRALSIDEDYADAHFNLSRLLEATGDRHGALRHLSTFRRLTKQGT